MRLYTHEHRNNSHIATSPTGIKKAMPALELIKRQYVYYYDPWYYWIRWAVIGGIILAITIALLISYWHAKKRVRNGLRPLQYHAWMIPYGQRAHLYETGYVANNPAGYQVPLGQYPYPPPPPPVYQTQPPYWGQPQNNYPVYHEASESVGAPQKY